MSVKKNFLYNVAYQVLTLVLPLVTAPYLSRVLGSEGLGTYFYTYSVACYFVVFALLSAAYYFGTKNPYLRQLLRGVARSKP